MIYSGGYQVVQYCNGGAWVSTGPVGNTTTGLVGWWKLDETSGASAADSSGSGNAGVLTNGPVWTTSGMNNGALQFDGTNDYLDVGHVSQFDDTTNFSMGAWIYPTRYGDPTSPCGIKAGTLFDRDNLDYSQEFAFDIFGDGSQLVNAQIGATPSTIQIQTTIPLNQWSFVYIVMNTSAQTYTMYLNGVQAAQVSTSGKTWSNPTTYGDYIGGNDFQCGGNVDYFQGTIDDFRIYNRALSAADVYTLYTSTGGESGDIKSNLIHYWKLDEPPGATTAADSAGGATLTVDSPATFTSGKISNAYQAEPSGNPASHGNAHVTMPADMLGKSQLTMSMWFKDVAPPTNVDLGYHSAVADEIAIQEQNGTLYYCLSGPGGGSVCDTDFRTEDTNWHLATMVFDGTQPLAANRTRGYLDGAQVTFGNASTPATTTTTGGLTFTMGDWFSGDANILIDDVRIYNRALSASDVLTLYNSTVTSCTTPVGYAGDYIYNNGSNHVLQYCNGTSWIPMGPVPGAGGAGCSGPAGSEGAVLYNSDKMAMQYCDGTSWIPMGGAPAVGSATGLVGWWKLDEGSGTSAADSAGTNTGTLTGGAAWIAGKVNGAVSTDGATGVVTSPGITVPSSFSVSFWVKTTTTVATPTMVFSWGPAPRCYFYISFFAMGSIACDNRVDSSYSVSSTFPINDGQWHHVVYTANVSLTSQTLYVDGNYQATLSHSMLSSATYPVTIGSNYDATYFFNGSIDDFRIYNRVLTASEVSDLYYATGGP